MSFLSKREALARQEIFAFLSESEQKALLEVAEEEIYGPGQVVFLRGDPGDYGLLVLSGRLRISVGAPDGKEILLSMAGPGAFVGEMALLDGQPRSADVQAEEQTLCLRVGRNALFAIVQKNEKAMMALMRLLTERVRRTTEQMEMIALQGLPGRLARYLLQLAAQDGKETAGGVRLSVGLTQSDMAEHLAASREAVNKLLSLWQDRGLIALLPQQDMVLKNLTTLREIAGG